MHCAKSLGFRDYGSQSILDVNEETIFMNSIFINELSSAERSGTSLKNKSIYVHLGDNVDVITSDIIGIFNIETTTISSDTKNFLKISQRNNIVKNIAEEKLPFSFIVASSNVGETAIYISAVSSLTLKKRISRGY